VRWSGQAPLLTDGAGVKGYLEWYRGVVRDLIDGTVGE
jgi:hypothetical protein